MASTTQPNNARVKYRGHQEREMAKPATMPGQVDPKMPKGSSSTPKTVAKPSRMRQRQRMRIKKAAKRGLISDKAMAKHFGE
jgi:Asp-tRNA(Asn)/Glu-tRNA(Gln) amidotransferase B subunit